MTARGGNAPPLSNMIEARLIRNLRMISIEGRVSTRRYIAKPMQPNGIKRWGVYDQKAGKYLCNREVEALSENEMREPYSKG